MIGCRIHFAKACALSFRMPSVGNIKEALDYVRDIPNIHAVHKIELEVV